ncbi:hypothetical protein [Jeongeupia sp. USM3]|uniref:hypothetical protein n=1 Tax=Jeongeupia sp. USM3 TaxID=1906741 RepID=UPI00089DEBCE|nr:hypothetical protein [Jeongeupia sp. USM3]AOX99052.1 hypothetical protein BJP62_00445 [Jeongeupia sp. USM3]
MVKLVLLAMAISPWVHADEAASAEVSSTGLSFESAFATYQAYKDESTGDWREANRLVDHVGGWRVYAKEAAQSGAADAHAGHGGRQ